MGAVEQWERERCGRAAEATMTPNQPAWLERWLQREDDVLLYWDQTCLLEEGPLTREEDLHAMHDHTQEASARERTRQIIEERLAWAQEEQRDES